MKEVEYLLIKLAEECAEITQRVTKALTFGLTERQADGPSDVKDGEAILNNLERIALEMADLEATFEVLQEKLNLSPETALIKFSLFNEALEKKKAKLQKYMDYSRSIGVLTD